MSHEGALLLTIAALPFVGALLPGLMIRAGRNVCAITTAVPTLAALTMLLILAPAVLRGEVVQAEIEWLPQLGLSAAFFLDGLGLLFAGMILGVGSLIILYARFYLSGDDPMGQFYTYLLLFQGAMLGIVLSDNILLLLIFWELTSLSVVPADRLLEAPARGPPGRAYGACGHGCGRACDDRGHADPRQYRGQLQPDGYPAVGGFHQILGLVPARADPDPAGRLHQVRSVPVPFLAAARDGRADAGLGLPAFGHDGEGGGVLDGAHVARAGGDRCLVLHRRHHGPRDDGAGRADRAFQGRSEGAPGVLDRQPSGPFDDASWASAPRPPLSPPSFTSSTT
jgi:hypothetical protein